jgi:hypothetical protein
VLELDSELELIPNAELHLVNGKSVKIDRVDPDVIVKILGHEIFVLQIKNGVFVQNITRSL